MAAIGSFCPVVKTGNSVPLPNVYADVTSCQNLVALPPITQNYEPLPQNPFFFEGPGQFYPQIGNEIGDSLYDPALILPHLPSQTTRLSFTVESSPIRSASLRFIETDGQSVHIVDTYRAPTPDHSDTISLLSAESAAPLHYQQKMPFEFTLQNLDLEPLFSDQSILKSKLDKDLKTPCCKGSDNFKVFLSSPDWQVCALDNLRRLVRAVRILPKDINGAAVIVIKPGPVSKTKQDQIKTEMESGWFRERVFDRRCFEVFVSEADLRLISFYSTFRFVARTEAEKEELFNTLAGNMTSLWALKTLGYMRKHQKEEIVKNEQKQKKIFTWAINKLEKIDSDLAEEARSLSTAGGAAPRVSRNHKIEKKPKKKETPKTKGKPKKGFQEPEPKSNGINFNQSTYTAWHDHPQIRQQLLGILRGASDQELIEMLTEDVFGEVQAAINNFKSIHPQLPCRPAEDRMESWRPVFPVASTNSAALTETGTIQQYFTNLFPKDAPSTTLDAYYTRIAMNSSRSVTSRHTWTFSSLKDAILHCEEQITKPKKPASADKNGRNLNSKWVMSPEEVQEMNIQSALDLAYQTKLITEGQMGLLLDRLESMLNN